MKTTLVFVSAALILAASPAFADAAGNACFNRDVERIDHYITPPEGGDNAFFTAVATLSNTTNVGLVIEAKKSMNRFTERLYDVYSGPTDPTAPTGCNFLDFNKLQYFAPSYLGTLASSLSGTYSPPCGTTASPTTGTNCKTYPDPDAPKNKAGAAYGGPQSRDQFFDGLIGSNGDPNMAYQFGMWPSTPSTSDPGNTATAVTADTACTGMADPAGCKTCLQQKGYYINSAAFSIANPAKQVSNLAGAFTVNWLRFNPPKWVILTLAYKRLVNSPLLSSIRESVIQSNYGSVSGDGAKAKQKMLPQNCDGTGNGTQPLNDKQRAVDDISYSSGDDPLAEVLTNTAWYMGGQEQPWVFASGLGPNTNMPLVNGDNSAPCANCLGSPDFVVLFSDGRSDRANPACQIGAGVAAPAWCSDLQQCGHLANSSTAATNPGISDGDKYVPTEITDPIQAALNGIPSGSYSVCSDDYAPSVAWWMKNKQVSVKFGQERIQTLVIALGNENHQHGELNVLKDIAQLGGNGKIAIASNFTDLESAIEKAFTVWIGEATSFSSAAITTVQSQGYTSAYIPRFSPQPGPQWKGTLERLDFFNEFSDGCSSSDLNHVTAANPNGNNSCTDVYLTDKNGAFVAEQSGQFVELDSGVPWDGGWPAALSDAGTKIPAVPYWEASDELTKRVNGILAGDASAEARKIFTAAPNASGGYDRIDFTEANVSNITPLLKLGGLQGVYCDTLSSLTHHSYTVEDDCARDVIKFMAGVDVLLQNPYNRTISLPDGGLVAGAPSPQHARPNILGDMFHSTPVLVTPPVPRFLCDLGIATQCVPSLYDAAFEPGGMAAYDAWRGTPSVGQRDQFLLVGANDGMLHAFRAGIYQSDGTYNRGDGKELWAFIPPEMLPKLIRYVIGDTHQLMVDGTPMVRDIWVDSTTNPGTKDSTEFHTVAIFGDREGGRRYTALDVTDPSSPLFLWSYPPPTTSLALATGQSWNDLGPSAPPIGPIAEKVAANPDGTYSGFVLKGDHVKERYIVAFGGGYDPAFMRGRSINFLDAYTGATLYRFSGTDSSNTLAQKLFPVAAPVSLLDTDGDAIFDAAAVGDVGGQLWTVTMPNANVGSSGTYDNWAGARAFVNNRRDSSGADLSFAKRSPFFQRAVAARDTLGQIWLYLGSGDRSQIKDPNGGTCGLANLGACIRKSCSVDVKANTYGIVSTSGSDVLHATSEFQWSAGNVQPAFSSNLGGSGALSCDDNAQANVNWQITCAADAGTFDAGVSCNWQTADGGPECPVANTRPAGATVYTGTVTVNDSRFYAVRMFDGTGNRVRFDTSSAGTYDSAAVTDKDLVNATDGGVASGTQPGWYVEHMNSTDERTSSSALLLSGCVVWNTLMPNSNNTLSCDGTIPLDTAYTYQANAISGAVQCGDVGSDTYNTTQRFRSRSTYVAPQPPAPVISVNSKTGQVAYGSVSLDPGSPPSAVTLGTSDVVKPIHWLEVPRKMHDCRHGQTNCN